MKKQDGRQETAAYLPSLYINEKKPLITYILFL